MIWEVVYRNGLYSYVEGLTIGAALERVSYYNWQAPQEIISIQLVQNSFGPDTVDGWYSGNRPA